MQTRNTLAQATAVQGNQSGRVQQQRLQAGRQLSHECMVLRWGDGTAVLTFLQHL